MVECHIEQERHTLYIFLKYLILGQFISLWHWLWPWFKIRLFVSEIDIGQWNRAQFQHSHAVYHICRQQQQKSYDTFSECLFLLFGIVIYVFRYYHDPSLLILTCNEYICSSSLWCFFPSFFVFCCYFFLPFLKLYFGLNFVLICHICCKIVIICAI